MKKTPPLPRLKHPDGRTPKIPRPAHKADLLTALHAVVMLTKWGWCIRTWNNIPMGMTPKQQRLVNRVLNTAPQKGRDLNSHLALPYDDAGRAAPQKGRR